MERRQRLVDFAWIDGLVRRDGPAAAEAALANVAGAEAAALRGVLARHAHLLQPLEPAHSVTDALIGQARAVPELREAADDFAASREPGGARLLQTVRRPESPAPRRVIAAGGPITGVALAPDGSWLAVGGSRRPLEVWDVATGLRRPLPAAATGLSRLAVAPDGTWLAGVGEDRVVRLVDVRSGRVRGELPEVFHWPQSMAVGPDGDWLAVARWDGVYRWDVRAGRELPAHRYSWPLNAAAVAPDGRWIAAAYRDNGLRVELRDTGSGATRALLRGPEATVSRIAVAPGGGWLAAGTSEGTVVMWNAGGAEPRAVLRGHTGAVSDVAVAPDGGWLASTSHDGTLRLWDARTGRCRAVVSVPGFGLSRVRIGPAGDWLAVVAVRDPAVRIWDVADLLAEAGGDEAPERIAGLVAGADQVWVGTQVRDADTGKPVHTLEAREPVRALVAAPDGSWYAGSEHGAVRIWDTGGDRPRTLPDAAGDTTRPRAASRDGRLLAAIAGAVVVVWHVATGKVLCRVRINCKQVHGLAFGADGRWLALACSDGRLRIVDVATGRNRRVIRAHTHAVAAVALAPDGTWLATAGWDRTVRTWDARTGKPRTVLFGLTDWPATVAIAPDGEWIAAGGHGGVLHVWQVRTGELSASARVDARLLNDCRWSGDGTALSATGGGESYVFAFSPPPRPSR
ncbi:hypothetical protein ACQP1P_25740 [Dactylosporangium sp. CA-052675]|uniref:WD40 domain-containing protein n=1 Tax=Dactylosporangium sp. CA-052675 TaxID=3239927 RepID=UPI003D8B8887